MSINPVAEPVSRVRNLEKIVPIQDTKMRLYFFDDEPDRGFVYGLQLMREVGFASNNSWMLTKHFNIDRKGVKPISQEALTKMKMDCEVMASRRAANGCIPLFDARWICDNVKGACLLIRNHEVNKNTRRVVMAIEAALSGADDKPRPTPILDERQVELVELKATMTELEDVVMDMNAPCTDLIEGRLETLKMALNMLIVLGALDKDTKALFRRAVMGTISPLTDPYGVPVSVPGEAVKMTHVAERIEMLGFEYNPTAAKIIGSKTSARVRKETGVEPMAAYRTIVDRKIKVKIYSGEAVKILDEEIYSFFAQP